MRKLGWAKYRSRRVTRDGPIVYGSWIGDETPRLVPPSLQAVRLHPQNGNYRNPTQWGVVAETFDCPSFDYETKTYHWKGEGDTTTAGGPRVPLLVAASNDAVVVGIPPSLTSKANLSALNGIKNQSINIGQALGELPQTIASLAKLANRIARALRHAKRGAFVDALAEVAGGRGTKGAAATWLEVVFGIMPLINDAYGLQEQVKKGLKKKGDVFSSRGFASQSYTAQECSDSALAGSRRFGGGGEAMSRVVYKMRISNEFLYALNQLGLANPASLVWELLTLSFVIDWFIPIGGFLDALTGSLGTAYVFGYEDRIFRASTRLKYCRYGFDQYVQGTVQSWEWRYFAFERKVLYTSISPSLHLGSGISNLFRAITSVALLRQRS